MVSLTYRLLFFLFVSLYVLSCATDAPLHFRFDPDTTESEKSSAAEAMASWNRDTLDSHQLVLDTEGPWRITFTTDLREGLNGRTCNRLHDEARDCADDHWIRIRRGLPLTRERISLKHELGHSLRLKHINEKGHIMSSDESSVWNLTEADLRECQRVEACGMITVHPLEDDSDVSDVNVDR